MQSHKGLQKFQEKRGMKPMNQELLNKYAAFPCRWA